ncbi:MAG TPA: Hsp70 family protein [Pseudonocardiaceae bacterium]|jgi:molecular chaperone DnaK|nr:Hsp70 family protein [Pseudonocardiaceae bacterium]
MGYWLGIDVGTTVTAAAVCRKGGLAEAVALDGGSALVPSVVYLSDGGQAVVGAAAVRHALTDPDRVVRGFIGRIGDEVPMVIAGQAYTAAQLAAMLIGWVVDQVASQYGGPAAGIMVTHPISWGDYKRQVLATALATAGLTTVRLCPEPHAAAAGYAAKQPLTPGQTVAIYDLGGTTFHATVLRAGDPTEFTVLGRPHSLAQLGGANFDDAVFGHVLAVTPVLAELDPDDPATLAATATLRHQCTLATQALSADTEVTIPVTAAGITTSVRLHRAEFDDMIRPQLAETVHALHRTLESAQLSPTQLDTMLLAGGSSRIPLVAQLLSTEFNQPVTIDADPSTTIARGAAILATPHRHLDSSPPSLPADTTLLELPDNPPPPSLTAIPLDVDTIEVHRRLTNSRRAARIAVSSALAVLTAAGVAAVPFLIARSDSSPSANAGTPSPNAPPSPSTPAPDASPVPAPASPPAGAGTGGEISSTTTRPSGVIRKTPAAAPHQLADPPAKPDPATVPASAPAPDWVTTYTWTTSWSNPPPTTTRTTVPSTATPTATTTPRTTAPPRTTTTTAAPPTTSSTQHRRPPT